MQRLEDESFEQYKERRAAANKATKEELKPKTFHDSATFGTYTNPEKRTEKAARSARKALRNKSF